MSERIELLLKNMIQFNIYKVGEKYNVAYSYMGDDINTWSELENETKNNTIDLVCHFLNKKEDELKFYNLSSSVSVMKLGGHQEVSVGIEVEIV